MSTLLSPLAAGEELTDEESFLRLHAGVGGWAGWRRASVATRATNPEAIPPTAPRPQTLDPEDCRTRREVEQDMIRRARAHAAAAALFLVRRGGIEAVCCDPLPPRTPGPIYWTTRPRALAAVLEHRRVLCGARAQDPLTRRILRSLGRNGTHRFALFPVSLRERLVAILYADAGDDRLPVASMAALEDLCESVALTWERMIRARSSLRKR